MSKLLTLVLGSLLMSSALAGAIEDFVLIRKIAKSCYVMSGHRSYSVELIEGPNREHQNSGDVRERYRNTPRNILLAGEAHKLFMRERYSDFDPLSNARMTTDRNKVLCAKSPVKKLPDHLVVGGAYAVYTFHSYVTDVPYFIFEPKSKKGEPAAYRIILRTETFDN